MQPSKKLPRDEGNEEKKIKRKRRDQTPVDRMDICFSECVCICKIGKCFCVCVCLCVFCTWQCCERNNGMVEEEVGERYVHKNNNKKKKGHNSDHIGEDDREEGRERT